MKDCSVLDSVKEALGIESEYNDFDKPILLAINSAIVVLIQLGIGSFFVVRSREETYKDYLGDFVDYAPLVNEYIYYYVKLNWDTPQSSPLISAVEDKMREIECRLILFSDNAREDKNGGDSK